MTETPMQRALALAQKAAEAGEVPVGAVIFRDGELIAEAENEMRRLGDPTAHAEMVAIRRAIAATGQERLTDCDLYVTLEPCTMCAGAIAHARLRRLYYAAEDLKGGAVDNGVRFFAQPTCHHAPEVIGGIEENRAAEMLRQFFLSRR
ncbi:nucleoside deaminase [Cucumibacter marinus]|uniref:nucleoside deaminase n=1 Tax=Cucumibacter marinus TaxID=1121252 RepID=UPI000426D9B7|nr:nucleoside deaminase [Cucumibacter marinus]